MGFWSSLLKYGGKAARGTGHVLGTTSRTVGSAALHPQRTLTGAGRAMKTAAAGGAVGYVAWEKLTTDKSVARIVGDAVIGESATDTVAQTADDVRELKDKAGEAVDAVNNAASSVDNKFSGISDFFRNMFGGGGGDMIGNFFGNIGRGNVSGLSIVGLVAAAFMVFGRFGWMSKIAGALLGMMIIGNNSRVSQSLPNGGTSSNGQSLAETESQGRGMRR